MVKTARGTEHCRRRREEGKWTGRNRSNNEAVIYCTKVPGTLQSYFHSFIHSFLHSTNYMPGDCDPPSSFLTVTPGLDQISHSTKSLEKLSPLFGKKKERICF